jgi:magnesium-transporting ATPase (P-type)
LEETYEGTPAVKSAKLYILKDKLTSFKMKDDESILEMFHRLQVIVNDLKALGEKINDDDVSHRFLMCLPPRFETLRLIIIRGGLKQLTPNQVLGDVMTQKTYRVERDGADKDEKKEDEDKKKSVAFKASSSSKNNDKSKKQESSDDEDGSDIDDEAVALFVRKFGKFMKKKKKGYGARKRRDNNKSKEYVRRCYNCKSPNYIMAYCPYNSDNNEDEKKKKQKE